MPFEYCRYGPHPKKCEDWMKENAKLVYRKYYGDGTSDEAKGDTKQKGKARGKASKKAGKIAGEKIVKIFQIQRTKRKFVTSVIGLDAFGLDLKQSAKKMSKQFACSASVVKNNPPPNEIQIQGDVKFEVAEMILQKFKVPKKFIYFQDAKGKKKQRAFD
eukprot:CAMPEP_0114524514 /NCGR_PEP_ID=MMETSP0109-20121206/21900_1 /TAXON_ID=29199 /ORGANISM="Chlorarachnion reptans, Strain CCCM449" /LENGTH=159 /DNA_ID=CAMNT_0001705971 /DNA_START=73 /DNA_END=552 /DNA_ORIENTATION=+